MRIRRMVLGLIVSVAVLSSFPVCAESFDEATSGLRVVGRGTCEIESKTFECERALDKNDKAYLIIYRSDGRPYFIVRSDDSTIVWVAGVEV